MRGIGIKPRERKAKRDTICVDNMLNEMCSFDEQQNSIPPHLIPRCLTRALAIKGNIEAMSDLQKVLHVFALVVYMVNVSAVLSARYQYEVLDLGI